MKPFRAALQAGLLIVLTAVTATAQGQGNHRGRPPRPPTAPSKQGTGGRTELPAALGRTLAGWLDDAETLEPGTVSLGLGVGRWNSLDGAETDGPVVDVGVGVANRVQLTASVPYYRANYSDGFQASGLGDTYVAGKIQLVDPGEHRVGLAIAPLLEILSEAAVSDTTLGLSRTNWALPLSVQAGTGETRVYGTVGYFSRGALFTAGAVEHALTPRVTLTLSIVRAYSTRRDPNSDLMGLSRSRVDATGAVSVRVAPGVTLSAGAGRTVSQLDQNGARFTGSAGVTIVVPQRRSRP